MHGASNIPPQADKQGLHHRVCGYDPARVRHDNRSLSAQKGENNIRFYVQTAAFLHKKAAAEKQLRNENDAEIWGQREQRTDFTC